MKIARHSKGDATGNKSERPNIRSIPKGKFISSSKYRIPFHDSFRGHPDQDRIQSQRLIFPNRPRSIPPFMASESKKGNSKKDVSGKEPSKKKTPKRKTPAPASASKPKCSKPPTSSAATWNRPTTSTSPSDSSSSSTSPTPSKPSTTPCWPKIPRPSKTRTNTWPKTSSGCPRKPAGRTSRPTPSKAPSAPSSTMPCAAREGQRVPQRRAPQGLQPPGPQQGHARRTHRPHLQNRPARRRQPLQGHPRPGLRILPRPIRRGRRQARRRILHAPLRGPRARRHAGTQPGPRLRSLLRLRRHVRAVRKIRRWPMAAASATSPSTARKATTPPGAWPR